MGAPEEWQFSHWVMEPFRVFTTVKYAMELAPDNHRKTHFWGSKAGKGLRGIHGFLNPEECLLTQQWSALPANPTPTSKEAIAA
jgi:hypothetical protein